MNREAVVGLVKMLSGEYGGIYRDCARTYQIGMTFSKNLFHRDMHTVVGSSMKDWG